MKQKTAFCCEFCGNIYMAQDVCEECEAIHFGLTRREYLDWRMLNKDASSAGKKIGVSNNEETRAEFDKAVESLVRFESEHGLDTAVKKPSDFYY